LLRSSSNEARFLLCRLGQQHKLYIRPVLLQLATERHPDHRTVGDLVQRREQSTKAGRRLMRCRSGPASRKEREESKGKTLPSLEGHLRGCADSCTSANRHIFTARAERLSGYLGGGFPQRISYLRVLPPGPMRSISDVGTEHKGPGHPEGYPGPIGSLYAGGMSALKRSNSSSTSSLTS
jgi:hypothetical protein